VFFAGVFEFAGDVGEARYGDDGLLWVPGDEGAVGAQAVALEVATERGCAFFANEDGVETGVGPAFVPVK